MPHCSVSDREPRALVWSGGDTRLAFMVQPALRTIADGLRANCFNVTVGSGARRLHAATVLKAELRDTDVFVWVGIIDYAMGIHDARRLAARGVMTVFYGTESHELWDMNCTVISRLPVHEIWQYTHSNIARCPPGRVGKTVRYVPPGHVHRTQLAPSEGAAASLRMLFLGGYRRDYDKRRACLNAVHQGLTVALLNHSHGEVSNHSHHDNASMPTQRRDGIRLPRSRRHPSAGTCSPDTRAQPASPTTCPLQVASDAYTNEAWDQYVAMAPYFLNVHKACNATTHSSTAACESFRMSMLLSAGALVFSEHCHPLDEQEYADLVHFAPVPHLAPAAFASWNRVQAGGIPMSPRERMQAFSRRFSPDVLFERAGLRALFSERRAPPPIELEKQDQEPRKYGTATKGEVR